VQASIPFPAPTQAAVFDPGFDGSTIDHALVTLTGTCQFQNPTAAVVIMRGSDTLGSTACSGTFSIQVTLAEGDNILVARTVNPSMLYGPDSNPITVTVHLPPTITPTPATPTPTSPPSTAEEVTATTDSGAAGQLTANPTDPFSVLTDSNDVTIRIRVSGGTTPYTININWGDGSVESHVASEPGEYSFTHTYDKTGSYKVRGSVRDVLGTETLFEYAVVSGKKLPNGGSAHTNKNLASDSFFDRLSPYLLPLLILLLLAALIGFGYYLGLHRSARRYIGRPIAGKKAPKKSAARRKPASSRSLAGGKRKARKR
jgi:hypothetical protein